LKSLLGKQADSGWFQRDAAFIFFVPRWLYLTRKSTAWFTGSAVCDDSQFFANAT